MYVRHGKEIGGDRDGVAWGGQGKQLRLIGTIAVRGLDAASMVDPSVLSFSIFAAGVFAVGLAPHLVVQLWNSCCWSIESFREIVLRWDMHTIRNIRRWLYTRVDKLKIPF